MNKRTKIVATIGPATQSVEVLSELLRSGMNVMRLNFSHGDFAEHQGKIDNLKKACEVTGMSAAVLQDLSGPKIRIGDFYQERVMLKEGDSFTLTTEEIVGDEHKAHVNYPELPQELKPGNFVLLDDGKKKLEVVSIKGNEIKCKVIIGGETKGRRGVNLPGAYLKISSITLKDKKDLEFGIQNKVDFVALSFVRRAEDVIELREILAKAKLDAKIISKIENHEGVENLDRIIEVSDGIMVARGDMAIEVPAETVPMIQKDIIKKCNLLGKPVITATQMLESMIKSPVPTRAEVSDVANAILDGTDAIMLSEETTLGSFPIEAVQMMTRVANEVEKDAAHRFTLNSESGNEFERNVSDSVTGSVVYTAHEINAKLIVALTMTGHTARMLSRYKPTQPIIALSPNEKTCSQLLLTYGCDPLKIEKIKDFSSVLKAARKHCLKNNIAKKGDKIVVVAGMPFGKAIETNMLLVEVV